MNVALLFINYYEMKFRAWLKFYYYMLSYYGKILYLDLDFYSKIKVGGFILLSLINSWYVLTLNERFDLFIKGFYFIFRFFYTFN